MAKYKIDVAKLYEDVETKRLQNRISRDRLARRLGIKSESSLVPQRNARKTDMYAGLFVTLLSYLKKPMEEYLIENEVEVYDDANGEI